MSNIRTYNDLLEEKKRLEAVLVIQKGILRQDLLELREEFRPALHLLSIVGKMTNQNWNNPLIAMGVNLAGSLFLKNRVLSGSSQITRIIVPFLAQKVSTWLHSKNGIFQKLAGIWRSNKSNGHPVE